MLRVVRRFASDEHGQDLVENGLLMAFVVLASAALFASAGGDVEGIWSRGNTTLATANTALAGKQTPTTNKDRH